ncbi:MAG: hypothetical protein GKR89_29890 [Candidatus Latescibacteria bacterium]|nr:hypothetical protein [Candidatus Latescibacterota bacterium]
MKSILFGCSALGLFLLFPYAGAAQTTAEESDARIVAELDAYWAEVARTIEEGDFEGCSRLYHPDAVLVNLEKGYSVPIPQALTWWEKAFRDTQAGKTQARFRVRFSRRIHDETTAHESGIFEYWFKAEDGSETTDLVHFADLFVKKEGRWLTLMEYQKQSATAAEWAALAPQE